MDLNDFSVDLLRGKFIGIFCCMNGGKTETLIKEMKRAGYFSLNSIAYNSLRNIREQNAIVADGREPYPAKSVLTVEEIIKDYVEREKAIHSKSVGRHNGTDGRIIIDGVEHQKHQPLDVIGIDEVNLFCIEESETESLIKFVQFCKERRKVLYVSGLSYDFRHQPFAHVHEIFPHLDLRFEKKPACMAIRGNEKCTNTAIHTQRLWSVDLICKLGLNPLLEEMEYFDYVDKEKQRHRNEYVAAPFFDQTVAIEDELNRGRVYLPVCDECARLPYKKEVFMIYDAICQSKDPFTVLDNPLLTKRILDFLANPEEKWVKKQEERELYLPISFHHNRSGGYSS